MAAQTSVENRGPMYHCEPYFDIKKIQLPDSMYVLSSPIFPLTVRWPDTDMLRRNQIAKLEERETLLRKDLDVVKAKLKSLGSRFGVPASRLDPLRTGPVDVAVAVPVTGSVAPLAALYSLLGASVRCSHRVVVHSSAACTASQAQRESFAGLPADPSPELTLTVIWKGAAECPAVNMMVAAGSQVPVVGMANVLRFLTRLFAPSLCGGDSPLTASQVDSWLDVVSLQVDNGNLRSQGVALRQANSRLGSAPWLAGERFTLADLYAFVLLCNLPGHKIAGNVQKWVKRCSEIPTLASLPYQHLLQAK